MRTVLVTGVAGFIGAQTARLLLEEGFEVVGIDNFNDYYDVRLKDYRASELLGIPFELGTESTVSRFANARGLSQGPFHLYHLDIEDTSGLERLFDQWRFEAILNLAARAGVRYSIENPRIYGSTNFGGTLNLLECARQHGTPKLVLASTSSLYAGLSPPYHEDLPANTPLSPYAATKKAAETMAYSYHRLFGIDVSVIRYFTVYGPAGRPDMAMLRFVRWIDEGRPLILYGDGSASRDFTYIDDIARGTVRAMRPLGYEIINLGGGQQPVSMNRIIATLEQLLDRKAERELRPFHKADMEQTWAEIGKAHRLLDWQPETDVDDGLRRTVDWYLAHRQWLRRLRFE